MHKMFLIYNVKLNYKFIKEVGGDEYITPAFPGVTLSVL